MQRDDEVNIFCDFVNALFFLDVARFRIDAASLFEVLIQNISPPFIYDAREASYVSFDGYLTSVASSFADFH